jgi:ATP/maltotriose-dependent transcriptional regulator MalT
MAAQASALLLTKLNRPPVTGDWIDRPLLIEQLNHSLQHGPLTLVCASAGFGKTTLVSSWLEGLVEGQRSSTRAAWCWMTTTQFMNRPCTIS